MKKKELQYMLIRFTVLIALVSLLLAGKASASSRPPVLDPARTVVIEGAIGRGNILQLIGPMLGMTTRDNTKPIDLVISSPGGDIVTGFMFINGMEQVRAEGGKIRCYVPTMAASMAFQILLHCDERYTLDRSFLLWHGVRTVLGNQPITAAAASELAKSLARTDEVIITELKETLGKYMSEELIIYHFEQETLHVGRQLAELIPGFIVSFKAIPGLMPVMLNPMVLHSAKIKLSTDLDSEYEISISGTPLQQKPIGPIAPDPLPPGLLQDRRDQLCRQLVPNRFEECKTGMNACITQIIQDKNKDKFMQCSLQVIRSLGGKV